MEGSPINTVFLLLGSNLGNRHALLLRASEEISRLVGPVQQVSSLYETAPWGVTDQPAFLNQVLRVHTALAPEIVLNTILDIEHALGRIRYERWGARAIDIDILFYSDLVCQEARLTIPHPHLHERRFTLEPLAEIAPDWLHPVLNKHVFTLLEDCLDTAAVTLVS